jgi:hypothetical protein
MEYERKPKVKVEGIAVRRGQAANESKVREVEGENTHRRTRTKVGGWNQNQVTEQKPDKIDKGITGTVNENFSKSKGCRSMKRKIKQLERVGKEY